MRLNVKWLTALIILAALPMSGCGFMQKLRARDNVNKGVKAFTDQKYSAAAQYFEKAIELDPEFETARMYLATTYTSQFIPGSADPKSEEMGQKSISTFKEIVDKCKDLSSENCKNAMLSIASLYYQMRQYPESKEWCNRILKVDGSNAEAYYRIAVIDFDDTFEKTGVQGEMVSLMTQEETEEALKSIEEGLTCLSKALKSILTIPTPWNIRTSSGGRRPNLKQTKTSRPISSDRLTWYLKGSGSEAESPGRKG